MHLSSIKCCRHVLLVVGDFVLFYFLKLHLLLNVVLLPSYRDPRLTVVNSYIKICKQAQTILISSRTACQAHYPPMEIKAEDMQGLGGILVWGFVLCAKYWTCFKPCWQRDVCVYV